MKGTLLGPYFVFLIDATKRSGFSPMTMLVVVSRSLGVSGELMVKPLNLRAHGKARQINTDSTRRRAVVSPSRNSNDT